MDDIVALRELQECVQYDFINRLRSLRAAENKDGWDRGIEMEKFISAFVGNAQDFLAHRVPRTRYFAAKALRKLQ